MRPTIPLPKRGKEVYAIDYYSLNFFGFDEGYRPQFESFISGLEELSPKKAEGRAVVYRNGKSFIAKTLRDLRREEKEIYRAAVTSSLEDRLSMALESYLSRNTLVLPMGEPKLSGREKSPVRILPYSLYKEIMREFLTGERDPKKYGINTYWLERLSKVTYTGELVAEVIYGLLKPEEREKLNNELRRISASLVFKNGDKNNGKRIKIAKKDGYVAVKIPINGDDYRMAYAFLALLPYLERLSSTDTPRKGLREISAYILWNIGSWMEGGGDKNLDIWGKISGVLEKLESYAKGYYVKNRDLDALKEEPIVLLYPERAGINLLPKNGRYTALALHL